MTDSETIRLELADDRRAKVKAATVQDPNTVELKVDELEERIAPIRF
jgi:hypothetical protein